MAMRLWTNQDYSRFVDLERDGVIWGDPAKSFDIHEGFEDAYRWMQEQMRAKLPQYSGKLPIWAWTHKMDARGTRWEYPKTEKWVRLEFECPDDHVLVSDFELWHDVLNGFAVCPNEASADVMWDLPKNHPDVLSSWQAIFNPKLLTGHPDFDPGWHGKVEGNWQQACVDGLRFDWLRRVQVFSGARQ